jgi:hypothetical protein
LYSSITPARKENDGRSKDNGNAEDALDEWADYGRDALIALRRRQ